MAAGWNKGIGNGRKCHACDSSSTKLNSVSHGPQWYTNKPTDLVLCNNCMHNIMITRTCIRYKGRKVYLGYNPRKGICVNCGKGGVKTHMHHKYYDDIDPIAGTVELCMNCHIVCTKMESDVARLLIKNGIVDYSKYG